MPDSTDPKELEKSHESWESAQTEIVTGSDDSFAASWYLTESRVWPLLAHPVAGPFVLGLVFFVIVVATVVLSPSTESHFIYTDF